MLRIIMAVMLLLSLTVLPADAELVVPGADGSDGVFSPAADVEVDLNQAAGAAWDTPSPVPGSGVYDSEKWAVVFKYSEVNIPSGVTVTFRNHTPNAPVVWLVSGSVTINGTVRLNGSNGIGGGYNAEPGPGGFRGGSAVAGMWSCGFGPGGGVVPNPINGTRSAGAYATKGTQTSSATAASVMIYGDAGIMPLIGGSGGAGTDYLGYSEGGAGGGAILIACVNSITVGGRIEAEGGADNRSRGCGGSGGAIRLVADTYGILSSGGLFARGGLSSAGEGRIRIEAAHGLTEGPVVPQPSFGAPGTSAAIWPETTAPSVKVTNIGGLSVPGDPAGGLSFPNQDVAISAEQAVAIRVEASNVPLDWLVKVRVTPKSGQAFWVDAAMVSGDAVSSVWEAQALLPKGFCAVQARANKP